MPSCIQQSGDRQRIDQTFEIFTGDYSSCIRLLIITCQLCHGLVKGNAYRTGDPQFCLKPLPKLVGNLFTAAEEQAAVGYVQPGFIQAEGFY